MDCEEQNCVLPKELVRVAPSLSRLDETLSVEGSVGRL